MSTQRSNTDPQATQNWRAVVAPLALSAPGRLSDGLQCTSLALAHAPQHSRSRAPQSGSLTHFALSPLPCLQCARKPFQLAWPCSGFCPPAMYATCCRCLHNLFRTLQADCFDGCVLLSSMLPQSCQSCTFLPMPCPKLIPTNGSCRHGFSWQTGAGASTAHKGWYTRGPAHAS